MVVIILPYWTVELEEKLDKVIKDLAAKHYIDILKINDSLLIKNAKENISHVLVDLYWNYKVEDRKNFENFEKSFKKQRRKTTSRKIRKGKIK